MIRTGNGRVESGYGFFSEKIMLNQDPNARWRLNLIAVAVSGDGLPFRSGSTYLHCRRSAESWNPQSQGSGLRRCKRTARTIVV
jgi:hypothetical protein